MQLQLERIDQAAKPGVAYPLVKKLLGFNQGKQQMVEVVILSRNDPVSGLRVFRSAKSVGLAIERGVFTRGRPPYHYLKSLQANLFLSANADDVRATLDAGFPAAMVFPQSKQIAESNPDEIRIAFDGDAVLFSDEAEQVFQSKGLDAFVAHESKKSRDSPTARSIQAITRSFTSPPKCDEARASPNENQNCTGNRTFCTCSRKSNQNAHGLGCDSG